ncbi:MAG: hypothetical protein GY859_09740 [Desulfobacterales bacterium]|nr:hypothetical protein [Desulfobacterales bacterium]
MNSSTIATNLERRAAMKKTIPVLLFFFGLISCCLSTAHAGKVLYVDSYHEGYAWSDDITLGVETTLKSAGVEYKITRMDTKRNKSEAFKKEAALKVKALIESWKPDVVIASDDNASKYLIAPYYIGADLPFVFCGVNWDASVYGFPAANVTGMVEAALLPQTLDILKKYAGGSKIGLIASDTLSERKNAANMKKKFNVHLEERYARTFDELKKKFMALQEESHLMIMLELRSVDGFDHDEMVAFVEEHTKIPTGAMQKFLADYALVVFSKIGQEQGEWAANAALKILGGKSPGEIPVVANKKGKIYLNARIAKKLEIKLPYKLVKQAEIIR